MKFDMRFQTTDNMIEIWGNVKTITDSNTLNNEIKQLMHAKSGLRLKIHDSLVLTSSVIGQLVHCSNKGLSVTLEVGSETLYKLLYDLRLDEEFTIARISA